MTTVSNDQTAFFCHCRECLAVQENSARPLYDATKPSVNRTPGSIRSIDSRASKVANMCNDQDGFLTSIAIGTMLSKTNLQSHWET